MENYGKIGKLCYKCCEKVWKIINIWLSYVLLEKKRKGVVIHIIPYFFLSSNHPE
jgi:hypothetical protein